MTDSRWRKHAREAIAAQHAQCKADGCDGFATLRHIRGAYPFGPKEYYPYKIWLDELRRWSIEQREPSDPLRIECPTRAAWPGRRCRAITTKEDRGVTLVVHGPKLDVPHQARIDKALGIVEQQKGSGPLFGDP